MGVNAWRQTKGGELRQVLAEIRHGISADGPILASLFLLWTGILAFFAAHGVNGISFAAYRFNFTLYLAGFLATLFLAVVAVLLRHRPDRPIGFLKEVFNSGGFARRFLRGLPMLAALVVFLPLFSKMKSAIPLFNSYTWDGTWIWLDRALHGTDPWRLLQVVFGYPLVTSALSGLYHLWIVLIYMGAAYFCFFQADRELRARFFIAYFACWTLLGIVMATILASVGPCFLGPLFGDQRFDEQMAYLRDANESYPVFVLPVQEGLAAGFRARSSDLGSGITAMPSMHVSLAFLFFLAMRQVSKLAGIVFGLFAAIILIGSVHLAYHYAVDGYVSIVATWLIWTASRPLARRVGRRADKA
jgi:hypothetical protein